MSLQRRTPLRAVPRGKGNRGEREIVDMLHARGWPRAYRNFGSGSQGGGDVIGGPAGLHIEVKRQERCSIWEWIAQAENDARPTDIPAVFFRRNRSEWYVTLPADELLALLQLRES
jgi:hypothetical protein